MIFQPRSGRRGTGFLAGPLRLGTTPSATVGPYLAIGLSWADGVFAAAEGTPGGVWIRGRVFDGAGAVDGSSSKHARAGRGALLREQPAALYPVPRPPRSRAR